ncbi:exodeoxyribonuclease III [Spongisporangium articulatum]|uniref:Exodeoxyribonuclease III n=1 Tax=Spongisporangium articulatum TaxID=3362603 RepID=A0ABW8APE8_9ACTN
MPIEPRLLTVASCNVNGVRAAVRRGMGPWLAATKPDVLCLQEVRAPDAEVAAVLGDGWSGVHAEAAAKGRAGVSVHSRVAPVAVRVGLPGFLDAGRWVEADVPVASGVLTVCSTYVHTGEADTPKQDEKYAFLAAMRTRLLELAADGRYVLVTGDFNICHHEVDLKNWKGNLKKSGFLPDERAWLTALLESGFVDVGRRLGGEGPGPYTWWSWRGQAFDNDAGWRIDYQLASANLAARAVKASVHRAATYAQRWSDHAPVVVTYEV